MTLLIISSCLACSTVEDGDPPSHNEPLGAGRPGRDALAIGDQIYFFSGASYSRFDVNQGTIGPGYPRSILEYWPGWPPSWDTPRGIDAVLDWGNGKVYFFRGSEYLRYDVASDQVDPGYPRPILGNWPGWPETWAATYVDAAFRHTLFDYAYVFRAGEYIRIDIDTGEVESGYPKPIAGNWEGVTPPIDAAFKISGMSDISLIMGGRYAEYDLLRDRVVNGPMPIEAFWPPAIFAP